MKRSLPLVGLAALLLVGAGCFGSKTTTSTNTSTNTEPTANANTNAGAGAEANMNANANANTNAGAGANANVAMGSTRSFALRDVAGGAKEYGTVTLMAVDDNKTKVTISLVGEPKNIVGEAQIRAGLCSDQSATIQYPLSPLVKGHSETTLTVNYSSFVGGTKQSVWVKTDPIDTDSPQGACGNIN